MISGPGPQKAESIPTSHPFQNVLFAFLPQDAERFFDSGYEERTRGATWFCPRRADASAFHEFLERERPKVVVSGWTTPQLQPEALAAHGGSVEYVCNVTGSVRHVVSRDHFAAGLVVSNWGTLIAPLVAEHALLLILASLRNAAKWRGFLQTRPLPPKGALETRCLLGKRVGIHGFGSIGQALVPLLKPFQVELLGYSGGAPDGLFEKHGVRSIPSIEELCRSSEVLVSCEALLPETRHELSAEALSQLPGGAVVINVGRGPIIDERALSEIAGEHPLRLGLDVFEEEPLALDSDLFTLKDAILSPHIAGPTHDFYRACGDLALENVRRFLRGEVPLHVIDLTVFDRST